MTEHGEFQSGEEIGGTRYRVLRLIGKGGMGSVYEVEHRELGKRFVLKSLLRELAGRDDLVRRLQNEWRALGRLDHPSIVRVTDAGSTSSGIPFYVMEMLQGETLTERLRRAGRMEVAQATTIATRILEALHAAHAIGIVHRDIKPSNVILAAGDRPKILDFGVAKIAGNSGVLTIRGAAIGTPYYMSPEQARGEPVDGRADIYAAGLLLFEMLTGVGPFEGAKDSNALIAAHIAEPAPRVSAFRRIPEKLADAVGSMLEKDPKRRPPTALQAAELLRAAGLPEAEWLDTESLAPLSSRPSGLEDPERSSAGGLTPEPFVPTRTEILKPWSVQDPGVTRTQAPLALAGTPAPATPPPSSVSTRPAPPPDRWSVSRGRIALGVVALGLVGAVSWRSLGSGGRFEDGASSLRGPSSSKPAVRAASNAAPALSPEPRPTAGAPEQHPPSEPPEPELSPPKLPAEPRASGREGARRSSKRDRSPAKATRLPAPELAPSGSGAQSVPLEAGISLPLPATPSAQAPIGLSSAPLPLAPRSVPPASSQPFPPALPPLPASGL